MAYNRITLMGRLTTEPSSRKTSSGISVTKFNLAVDRGFGDNKRTDFIPVVAFSGIADTIAKYVGKGQLVLVGGQLQTGSYEDKDGNKRSTFEVFATEFSFCETRTSSSTKSSSEEQNAIQGEFEAFEQVDEDLPF